MIRSTRCFLTSGLSLEDITFSIWPSCDSVRLSTTSASTPSDAKPSVDRVLQLRDAEPSGRRGLAADDLLDPHLLHVGGVRPGHHVLDLAELRQRQHVHRLGVDAERGEVAADRVLKLADAQPAGGRRLAFADDLLDPRPLDVVGVGRRQHVRDLRHLLGAHRLDRRRLDAELREARRGSVVEPLAEGRGGKRQRPARSPMRLRNRMRFMTGPSSSEADVTVSTTTRPQRRRRAPVPSARRLPPAPGAAYGSTMTQRFRPEQTHAALGAAFFDPVAAAAFPEARLRFRNDRWAARIGLDALTDADWIRHFGRFEPLPGSFPAPLALRYHGHQFRVYNPDIGDGRGFLFAQARDLADDRLLDLGTKGSGTTPWSRQGDGRLTLKGGVREILATEMLEALGVYTSKTLSLIETGEALTRGDEPSPTRASVLVRLSHSHIRIGTFQRFAAYHDIDGAPPPRRPRDRPLLARRRPRARPGRGPLRPRARRGGDARRRVVRRRLRPRRPQQRQRQHHRRELRLRPLAFPRPLRPRLHRRLLRPDRPLRLRPPARGAELEPRPLRRMPDPDLIARRDRAGLRQLRRPLPDRADPADLRAPRPAARRPRGRPRAHAPLLGRDAGDAHRRSSRPSTTSSAAVCPSACARARSGRSSRPPPGPR